MVFCREAISHFHEPYAFLDEAARVLKPGGKIFLSDGNNALNPLVRRKTYRTWQRFEKGPCGPLGSSEIRETLENIRRGILKREFADLSDDEVELLAQNTFAFTTADLLKAAQDYKATGAVPNSRYAFGKCPVDPDTGMRMEMLFSPRRLARYMGKCGIDSWV